jgi:signal transduction histidine kinase
MPAFKTLLQGRIFVSDNVQHDMADSQVARKLARNNIRALVSAPLVASGEVFGALNAANDSPASYSARHIAIVEEVSASVALAIHSARLRETLNKNSQQLQLLSARLIDAQEIERKRLSHELHDEMGQILTAISLNLAAIEMKLPSDSSETLHTQLADANDFVTVLTDQVRSLSLELRPAMLHELGLTSTLRWYVANYLRRHDTRIRFKTDVLPERLPENIEITAYRVVQEALTNVNRHSGATEVDLRITRSNGTIQIVVEDNGRGFDPASVSVSEKAGSGIGLVMMRERISTINGRLDITSRPGEGTRITAEIPFTES